MSGVEETPPGHPTASDIHIEGVTKAYPGQSRPAVDDVTMRIDGSMITVLIGPSGSGKTTILKMINRLVEPDAGRITIGDEDIRSFDEHKLRRSIGYVIQQIGLFPHWSIERNLATVPRLLGWNSKRIRAVTDELLELVGLDLSVKKRYPSQLSGGQQQRVGVARALAADPPILLMDEPFASVDPIVREHLQNELLRIQSRVKKTIVFVTHDMDEAFKLGDRIAILDGEGRLHQVGSRQDLLARPADDFVNDFLGRERALRVLAVSNLDSIPLADGPRVSASAHAGEVRDLMSRDGCRFAVVEDGDHVFGLIEEGDLGESMTAGDIVTAIPDARIYANATLRETLDYLLRMRRYALPVFDGDENYLGVVTMEQIREALP